MNTWPARHFLPGGKRVILYSLTYENSFPTLHAAVVIGMLLIILVVAVVFYRRMHRPKRNHYTPPVAAPKDDLAWDLSRQTVTLSSSTKDSNQWEEPPLAATPSAVCIDMGTNDPDSTQC